MQPMSYKRIVLVEADINIGATLVEALSAQPRYQINWILNPADFLDLLESTETWPPDLLVLDLLTMIGEQKERFKRLLTRVANWPPTLVMLGSTPEQAQGVVSRLGQNRMRVKNFDLPNLLTCVSTALGEVVVSEVPVDAMTSRIEKAQDELPSLVPVINVSVARHFH